MQCICCLKKTCSLWHKKLNLKVLTCFGMIWNYDKISKWNTKFGKISAFSKNCISPNLIGKKKWHIGTTINKIFKKFQNISFENSSLGKHVFFGKKDSKKNVSLKCKVNTLVCYMLFGPTCHFSFFLICYSLSCRILSSVSTTREANKNKFYILKNMIHLHFFYYGFLYLSLVLHNKV
jgi:hypothetical protein